MEIVVKWPYKGNLVQFACSADNWQVNTMFKNRDMWYYKMKLDYGKHEYKFIVDGTWCYDICQETVDNDYGTKNNIIYVSENMTNEIDNIVDELFYRFPDNKN